MFLPVTIGLYYLTPRRYKNLVLLIFSLIFYGWGEPIYILIMVFSTVFDYVNGLFIDSFRNKKKVFKLIFINSMVVNLGILGFFKYYDFIICNINRVFGIGLPILQLPLPIGISFYTFQTMSYVIDVYLDKVPVQRNIISFATYITMFPQLIAGPIVKYGDIEQDLNYRKENIIMFGSGIEYFIRGLAKKVLIANNIGLLWQAVKATPLHELSVLSAWLGIIGFTFQIYFDFSGYSDMAIGLGKMFGFNLMKNFDYPYISRSISEFWRRWHISLGSWFREYVYIPLGGNRRGKVKLYINLLIVWFLTGLWHGANWNFIIWGLYFAGFIIIERMFLNKWLGDRMKVLQHLYTLLVVVVGWVIFEFEDLSIIISYIKVMFGIDSKQFVDGSGLYYLYTNLILFIIAGTASTPLFKKITLLIQERMGQAYSYLMPVVYLFLIILSTAYIVNETYNPFLYFRF